MEDVTDFINLDEFIYHCWGIFPNGRRVFAGLDRFDNLYIRDEDLTTTIYFIPISDPNDILIALQNLTYQDEGKVKEIISYLRDDKSDEIEIFVSEKFGSIFKKPDHLHLLALA